MANRTPPAPTGLGTRAKKLWRDLHATWTFTPDETAVLELAVEAVDRADRAQRDIDSHGILVADRFGQLKANEAIGVKATAEVNAARLLKQLGLHVEVERQNRNEAIRIGTAQSYRRRRGA